MLKIRLFLTVKNIFICGNEHYYSYLKLKCLNWFRTSSWTVPNQYEPVQVVQRWFNELDRTILTGSVHGSKNRP